MKKFRLIVSAVFVFGFVALLTTQSLAFPPYLKEAKKFGAKDCRFCHLKPEGGEGHNARGKWLLKEKDRRKADVVDPAWLADYKASKKSGK